MGNWLILFHRYEPVFEALHRSLPVVAGELFVCLFVAIGKRTWPQIKTIVFHCQVNSLEGFTSLVAMRLFTVVPFFSHRHLAVTRWMIISLLLGYIGFDPFLFGLVLTMGCK